jgi:hypothetical protein
MQKQIKDDLNLHISSSMRRNKVVNSSSSPSAEFIPTHLDGRPVMLDTLQAVCVNNTVSHQMELGLVNKQSLETGSSSESPTICRRVDGTRTSAVRFGAEDVRGAVLASSGPGGTTSVVNCLDTAGLGGFLDQSTPLGLGVVPGNGFHDLDQDEFGTSSVRQTVGLKRNFVAAFPGHGSDKHMLFPPRRLSNNAGRSAVGLGPTLPGESLLRFGFCTYCSAYLVRRRGVER